MTEAEIMPFLGYLEYEDGLPNGVTELLAALRLLKFSAGPEAVSSALLQRVLGLLIGTARDGRDVERAYRLADAAVRTAAPLALEAAGLGSVLLRLPPITYWHGGRDRRRPGVEGLRSLPPITDGDSARFAWVWVAETCIVSDALSEARPRAAVGAMSNAIAVEVAASTVVVASAAAEAAKLMPAEAAVLAVSAAARAAEVAGSAAIAESGLGGMARESEYERVKRAAWQTLLPHYIAALTLTELEVWQ